jgi:DNA-binding MarR family transcriptional regulator
MSPSCVVRDDLANPRGGRNMDDHPIDTSDAISVATFRAALRAFLRTSEEIAQANGLTPRRHLLLLMIKGAPDGSESATITELAVRLQLAQSTVTELVKRAIEAGLVLRETSPSDARIGHLHLTSEGERRLARVFKSHEAEREKLGMMLAELESTRGERGRRQPS